MSGDSGRIGVVVVEDHALTRQGLRSALGADPRIDIVTMLASGDHLLDVIRTAPSERSVDVVVLDLDLPGQGGLELLASLQPHMRGPHALRVVIVSGSLMGPELSAALECGVSAVISKSDPPELVLESVTGAARPDTIWDRPFLSPAVATLVGPGPARPDALSPRQRAILTLLAAGESNKEVGYRLGIAPSTVAHHLSELRRKLGVGSNRKIVGEAGRRGLI